jgi:hypothetical protein
MVSAPVFSADGHHVAAAVCDDGEWGVAVDGEAWPGRFAMAGDPVPSPTGSHFAAVVDRDGHQTVVVDGVPWARALDRLWDPAFSPDGKSLLVRGLVDNHCVRHVVPVRDIVGA